MPTVKLNGCLTGLELALKKNTEIRKAQKNKYKTFAKSRACPKSVNLKRQAHSASKLVKKLIQLSRTKYEMQIIEKSKSQPKLLYSYINNQKNCKDHIRMLISSEGEELVEGAEIANCLNETFFETFT